MYTDNQIMDTFFKSIGRKPTDFEVSNFKQSSPQTLATVKDTYAKLNPNSIVDYLTSVGQDPSLQNRQALGTKYGITNIGTAEGNTALLNALKSGKEPTVSSVEGSITTPVEKTDTSGIITQNQDQNAFGGNLGATGISPEDNQKLLDDLKAKNQLEQQNLQNQQDKQQANTPPVLPEIEQNKTAYTTAQRAVLDVTKRVDEINKSIDAAMANKRDQIAASGGVVDESQLRSTVLAESAPLLAERKDLLSQRAQLVGEQNIAGKAYQDALNNQKQAEANFYKQQTADLAARKQKAQEEQFATKMSVNEQQFADKQALANKKVQKVNVYDEYDNVNGQALKIVDLNTGIEQTVTSLSPNGTYTALSGATIDSNSQPSTIYYTSPSYVNEYLGNADKDLPENTNVKVAGTMETLGSLYQDAVTWAFQNGKMPVGVGRSTKAVSVKTAEAIKQKGTALLNALGIDQTQAYTSWKANSGALTKLMGVYGQLLSNEGTADRNFKLLISLGQKLDANSYKSTIPWFNEWVRSGQINVSGNSDTVAYVGQLKLTLNEYAKVISGQTGGAAVSDSARNEVGGLLSQGQNINTVKDFYNNVVVPDLENRKAGAEDSIAKLTGGATSGLNKLDNQPTGYRTDRNNNMIAAAMRSGSGGNPYTKALDAAGISWEQGDAFPGDSSMSTIRITGDPTEGARAILANTTSIQDWYLNHTGKTILAQYGVKTGDDFKKASKSAQDAIIQGIYKAENGSDSGALKQSGSSNNDPLGLR